MISEKEIDKNTFLVLIDSNLINIDKKKIIDVIGYNSLQEHIESIVNDLLKTVYNKLDISAGYKVFHSSDRFDNLKILKNTLIIRDTHFNIDKIIASQLRNIEKAAVFVSTIGLDIENWIKELNQKGELLHSYIGDIIASEAAECATDLLHDFIQKKFNAFGMNITNRYSPGYCNWSVSEQQKLFSLLPENFCGIKLTESSLMIPIKSISGIIGIGRNVKWKEYLCDKCGVKDCTYRKIKLRKKLMA